MSFIGEDRVPAPKLKDARMSNSDLQKAYDQVVSVSNITSFKADAIVTIILSALKKDNIFLIFFNIVFSIWIFRQNAQCVVYFWSSTFNQLAEILFAFVTDHQSACTPMQSDHDLYC